jgi:G3E family GTPase
LKAFDWPQVRSRLAVDGVVAVVDAAAVADGRFADDAAKLAAQRAADPSVEHDNPLEEVYEDQLLCADIVVLNKTDLLSADDLARVSREVEAATRRTAKLVATREGHLHGEGMRRVDHRLDALLVEIVGEPLGAAEAADAHRNRRGGGVRCAAGERQRGLDIAALRQPSRQRAGFAGSAKQEQPHSVSLREPVR